MGPHSSLQDTSRMPDDYWRQLVTYGQSIKKDHPVLGDYAMLQRINLIHLQNDLANIKADIAEHQTTTECQMLRLRRITHEYANAIRDFEYMDQLALVPDADRLNNHTFLQHAFPDLGKRQSYPFDTSYRTLNREITLKGDIVRELLRIHLFRRLSWSPSERKAKKVEYHKGEPPKTYSPFVDSLARFIIAVGGGASLVVPMLIMSFGASKTKSLVTVSVAVVLFALSLSLGLSTDNKDTLTATATYAAVLVVFVGTSSTGS